MASYPDNYIEDGNVWCYYNVTTTGSATTLLYSTNNIASMEVDGVSATVAKTYTFSTEGEHLVKYSLTDNTVFGALNTGDRAAFRSVTTIKRCYLPETIKTLGNYQFASASNVEYVKFPSQLEVLGQSCFSSCSNLVITNLSLPSLTTLGSACFQNCGKIVKISNLGVITTIPNSVIRSMGALTDLILPSTLTSLADASIYSCSALKRVVCYAATPPSKYNNVFSGSTLTYIKVPTNSVATYKSASGWSSYASKIYPIWEERLININHMSLGDFRRRVMIGLSQDYWLPDDGRIWAWASVASDGDYQITNSYGGATYGIWSAVEIDGVTVEGTNRVQHLTAGEHLLKFSMFNNTILPRDLLYGREGLYTKIALPPSITTIGDSSLGALGTSSVPCKIIYDKKKITTIGNAFWHSYADIGEINFPNLTSLLSQAFSDYYGGYLVPRVVSLGTITSIPYRAFRGFIPANKTYLIPETVTSIADGAFSSNGDYNLIYYSYPTTPPTIEGAFIWRTPVAIYVPAESVEAYKNASGWSSFSSKIQAIPE